MRPKGGTSKGGIRAGEGPLMRGLRTFGMNSGRRGKSGPAVACAFFDWSDFLLCFGHSHLRHIDVHDASDFLEIIDKGDHARMVVHLAL